MDAWDVGLGWRMLDRRMLLVHPVKEVGRFLPALIGVVLFGHSADGGGLWGVAALVVPLGLGLARYLTTSYRITDTRVEVRHGLLNKRVLSTALDRVRTVDVTASPIHRLLGLVTLRIGTGQSGGKGDERLALDGLSTVQATELRTRLLHGTAVPEPGDQAPPDPSRVVLRLDLGWVRFAPLTTSGIVIAGAALGVLAQSAHVLAIAPSVDLSGVERLGAAVFVTVAVLGLVVVFCVLAVLGYLLANYGFRLTEHPDDHTWRLRRGLLTTRETTLDDARISGVSIGEPLGLRLARGGRLSAIVTGLDKKQRASALLVPPAPGAEVARVAAEVLGTDGPVVVPLVGHGPRAHRRRWTRALVPAGVLALGLGYAACTGSWVLWAPAVVVLIVGAGLAHDRWRGLGHALADNHLVARSGSLNRRREVLHTPSVIGWNLRATYFQRRAGLTDLTATTAGGRQRVRVLDLDEASAVELAAAAYPGLVEPFLASGQPTRADR